MHAFKELLKLAQKFKDGINLSEGQAMSIKCHKEAIHALNHMHKILKDACNFWKGIGKHCEDMKENILTTQVQSIKDKDTATRKNYMKVEHSRRLL